MPGLPLESVTFVVEASEASLFEMDLPGAGETLEVALLALKAEDAAGCAATAVSLGCAWTANKLGAAITLV